MLFQVWTNAPHRPTRDLDLLGCGDPSLEHCKVRVPIQVDVGFGDAVTPRLLDYPTLLHMPAPRIQAYPMDTVVAEKLEAFVRLGILNSRMKDFYDIWFLGRTFPFEAKALGGLLRTTFERRKTELAPDGLKILLAELSGDGSTRTQWRAFFRKSSLKAPDDFSLVNDAIREFLLFPADAASSESRTPLSWPPGGPWHRCEDPGPRSEQVKSMHAGRLRTRSEKLGRVTNEYERLTGHLAPEELRDLAITC